MFNENNKYHRIIKKIDLYDTTSSNLLIKSFVEIKPEKSSIYRFIISIVLAIIFSFIIATSENTLELSKEIFIVFLNTFLVLFTCALTIYTLTLSFFSKRFIELFANTEINGESSLQIFMEYYENILFLYFIEVFISIIAVTLLTVVDSNFALTNSQILNELICGIFLFLYFAYSFRISLELQSLIFNTVNLTRTNVSIQLFDLSNEPTDTKNDENTDRTGDVDIN